MSVITFEAGLFGMIVRRCVVAAAVLAAGAVLCGCPGSPEKQADNNPPPVKNNTGDDGRPTNPPPPDSPPPATPPTVSPPPDESNPQPTGANWVFTPQLHHRIGEKLAVDYKLAKPGDGTAWIGLVPENITAQDEPASDATDVTAVELKAGAKSPAELVLPRTGRYRLRLFASRLPDAALLGESPVMTIEQWPLGDLPKRVPPYVTIGAGDIQNVELQKGFPVVAYYEVPAGYPDDAWMGIVPAGTVSRLSRDNDAVDIDTYYLNMGRPKDIYNYRSNKLGNYVYRIFPSRQPTCEYVAQSEPFTIIPKAE